VNQVAVIESDAVVATMNRARLALAEAKTIQETKRIVDSAAAAEIYAKRQRLGEETSDLALSIKVEALRKLGEMLADKPKQAGARGTAGPGRGKNGVAARNPVSEAPTLSDLGLTKKESAVAQKLAALSDDEFQQVRTGAVTVSKAIAAVDATKRANENGVAARNPVSTKRKAEPEPAPRDELEDAVQALTEENERLMAENDTLRRAADPEAVAKIEQLKGYVSTVESQRDDWMNQCAQLKREVKRLQRQLGAVNA